jgi:hypothetical protein
VDRTVASRLADYPVLEAGRPEVHKGGGVKGEINLDVNSNEILK